MTAFITATRRKVDNTWLNASREIRAYLCDQTLEEVSVEIADPELFRPRHIFPVLKTDAVFPIWDTVRDTILNEINLVDVQMVGCYRLGKSVNLHDNPPTVLVLVSTKSNRTWKDTREVIVNILHRFNLPTVAVEICKDEIRRSGGTAGQIDRTILRGPAKLGQGLGIAWKEKASGTFGGFIELKSPTTGLWRTFGITSLHWLIPEKKDVHISRAARIRDWHQNGVKMLDKAAEEHLVLYHPSLDDMDAQLQHIDQVIKRISNNPFYKGALELEKQGLSNTQSRRDRHNFKAFKDQLQEHDEFANEISVNSALKAVIDLVSLLLHQASNKSRPSLSKMPHFSPIWTGLLSRLMPVEKEPTIKMVLYEFKPGSDDKDLTDQDLQIYGRTSGYSRGWYSGLRDALVGETVGDELTRLPTVEHSIVDVWETVLTEWGFGGLGAYNGWSTGGDALCWLRGEPDQLFHSCGWSV